MCVRIAATGEVRMCLTAPDEVSTCPAASEVRTRLTAGEVRTRLTAGEVS